MTEYTLGVADIQRATRWGVYRVRGIVGQPYPLPFEKLPPNWRGGNRTRRYRLGDVLSRCRSKPAFTQEMEAQLAMIDQERRK